jgi:hypothetical protein
MSGFVFPGICHGKTCCRMFAAEADHFQESGNMVACFLCELQKFWGGMKMSNKNSILLSDKELGQLYVILNHINMAMSKRWKYLG